MYGIYSLDLKKLIVRANSCVKKGQILKSNYPQTDLFLNNFIKLFKGKLNEKIHDIFSIYIYIFYFENFTTTLQSPSNT